MKHKSKDENIVTVLQLTTKYLNKMQNLLYHICFKDLVGFDGLDNKK